ncbi:hypothetical protein D9758_003592 [Tetrapyrgos nigripes]|uniref:Uncharacterized protein n=1 Tax=Tetrapyrgos nigripes TaxID=182062 RepID=A0A8H5GV84_9AGAR|nr:hypothetical protein D9758_003592 [Tetrapyrgos nigripes]
MCSAWHSGINLTEQRKIDSPAPSMESQSNGPVYPILNPLTPDIFMPPEFLGGAIAGTYLIVEVTGALIEFV